MSDEKRQALTELTQATMRILDGWRLGTEEMREILAMPETVRARAFHRFREGAAPFPAEPEVLRRAQYVLRIADSLRTSYPRNPEYSKHWIRRPHRRFGRRTPLAVILGHGESGMVAVLSELDCTFSWDLTGSQSDYQAHRGR